MKSLGVMSFIIVLVAGTFVSGCNKTDAVSTSVASVSKAVSSGSGGSKSPKLIGDLDINDDVFDTAVKLRAMGCEEITLDGLNGNSWILDDKSKTSDQQEKQGIMDWLSSKKSDNYEEYIRTNTGQTFKDNLGYKDVRDRIKLDELKDLSLVRAPNIKCKNLLVSSLPHEVNVRYTVSPHKVVSNKHVVHDFKNNKYLFTNIIEEISFNPKVSTNSKNAKFVTLAKDFGGECTTNEFITSCRNDVFQVIGGSYFKVWQEFYSRTWQKELLNHDFSKENKPNF